MRNSQSFLCRIAIKFIKKIYLLIFHANACILWIDERTNCSKTGQSAQLSGNFFEKLFNRFLDIPFLPCWVANCEFPFDPKRRKEGCLKREMPETSNCNITMIVCQIKKWSRSMRYWCPLNFPPYPSLKGGVLMGKKQSKQEVS